MSKRTDTEQLWKLCFGDSDEFIKFYFDKKYQDENTFAKYNNQQLISVLQAIPYTISIDGQNYSAAYISGACTHPEYRNQRCMSTLLQETLLELQNRNIDLAFLIPQEQWLYDFYSKFGFKPLLTNHIEQIEKPTNSTYSVRNNTRNDISNSQLYKIYQEQLIKTNCVNHSQQDFYDCMDEVFISNGTIFSIEENSQTIAFATANENRVEIFAEKKYHASFIYEYCQLYNKKSAKVLTQDNHGNSVHGMIYNLNKQIQIKTPIFANLLME
ncbi:MAG: GNAT family N-acetyltransferase [Bacteroidales bacterium]|nr:GNAT family N-acetyltransferase [Bacteroidales bacterium]